MRWKVFYRTPMIGGNGCQACQVVRISEDISLYDAIFIAVNVCGYSDTMDVLQNCTTEEIRQKILKMKEEEIDAELFPVTFNVVKEETLKKGYKFFAFSFICKLGIWPHSPSMTDDERGKLKYKCYIYAREAAKYITHSHVYYFMALGIQQSYADKNQISVDDLTRMIGFLKTARELVLEGTDEEKDKKSLEWDSTKRWESQDRGPRSFRYNIIAVLAWTYLKLYLKTDNKEYEVEFLKYNDEAKLYMYLNGSDEMAWVYEHDASYKQKKSQDYQEELKKYLLLHQYPTLEDFNWKIKILREVYGFDVQESTKTSVQAILFPA